MRCIRTFAKTGSMVSCFFSALQTSLEPNPKQSTYVIFTYIYHKNKPNVVNIPYMDDIGNDIPMVSGGNKVAFHYRKVRCCQFLGRRMLHYPSGESLHMVWAQLCSFAMIIGQEQLYNQFVQVLQSP